MGLEGAGRLGASSTLLHSYGMAVMAHRVADAIPTDGLHSVEMVPESDRVVEPAVLPGAAEQRHRIALILPAAGISGIRPEPIRAGTRGRPRCAQGQNRQADEALQ